MSFYFIIGFIFSLCSCIGSSQLPDPTEEEIALFLERLNKLPEEYNSLAIKYADLSKENKNLKRELDALRVQKTASCCPCVENKDDVKRKLFTKGSVLTINSKIVHLACSPQMQKSINESRTLLLYSRQKRTRSSV